MTRSKTEHKLNRNIYIFIMTKADKTDVINPVLYIMNPVSSLTNCFMSLWITAFAKYVT